MRFLAWVLLVVALPLATGQAALWTLDGTGSETDHYAHPATMCRAGTAAASIRALQDGSVDFASASTCGSWSWQFAPADCARTANAVSCRDNSTDPATSFYAFLQKDTLGVQQWRFALAMVDASDPANVGQIAMSGTLDGAAS